MPTEFTGIERRLDELSERLARLQPLRDKARTDFARYLAPLAGFRNILVHEYVRLDWDEVYRTLHRLEDLERFADLVRHWLQQRVTSSDDAGE